MIHTAERVGNPDSAKDGHFGVTGWEKSHIKFSGGKATITYVGKSGVKQKKTVSDKVLVKGLKDAYDSCADGSIFCHDTTTVNATKVNAYLEKFDITAKDLRGLHANTLVRKALTRIRDKAGPLPEGKSEKEAQLKKEFKEAIEETADAIGHGPSTLRSQYLTPNLEDLFLKDGTVPSSMVTARWLTLNNG